MSRKQLNGLGMRAQVFPDGFQAIGAPHLDRILLVLEMIGQGLVGIALKKLQFQQFTAGRAGL